MAKSSITFSTGIPDFTSVITVDGLGLCQLRRFYENGDVLLYMGGNRMFRVAGTYKWHY